MNRIFFCLLAAFCLLSKSNSYAQTNGSFNIKNVIPTSPEAALLGRFGDIPIGYYTGTTNVSIPLYTIKENGLEIPITLSYHNSGVKVEDEATNVGLGWSLEPGGAIIQIINGSQDMMDQLVGSDGYNVLKIASLPGYYGQRNNYGQNVPPCPQPETDPDMDRNGAYVRLQMGDGQPDIYQYHFPGGFSGKFFIHPETQQIVLIDKKAEIKFEGSGLGGWTATTLDGTKYYFGAWETSSVGTVDNYGSLTWKLTKIQFTSGKEINFTYWDGYYESTSYQERYHTDYPNGLGGVNEWGLQSHATVANNHTKNLKSISTDNVIVEFNYEDRIDLVSTNDNDGDATNGTKSAKRIKSVDIKDALSGRKVKSFVMSYDYFTYNSNIVEGNYGVYNQDAFYKRLKLTAVQEVGYTPSGQAVTNPAYGLSYDESVSLPSKASFSRDFWGYYNGQNNNHLIPDLSRLYYLGYPEYATLAPEFIANNYGGGNRFPDGTKMGAGLLKKITYPTGGYNEFDYEPNAFTNHAYPDMAKLNEAYHYDIIQDMNVSSDHSSTAHLQVLKSTPVHFEIMIGKGNPYNTVTFDDLLPSKIMVVRIAHNASQFTVVKSWQMENNQQTRDAFNASGIFNLAADYTFLYDPADPSAYYVVSALLPDAIGPQGGSVATAFINCKLTYYTMPDAANLISYGGGMRVKEIRNYTANGSLAGKKQIRYINEDGSCSGKIMSPLQLIYNHHMYFVKQYGTNDDATLVQGAYDIGFVGSESSIPYSDAAGGNIVGYDRVEEVEVAPDGSTNGKHIYQYHNNESNYKLNNPNDPDLLNGTLTNEQIKDASGNLLHETETYYQSINNYYNAFNGFKLISNYVGDRGCGVHMIHSGVDWDSIPPPDDLYQLHYYPINGRWYMPQGKITKEYANGLVISSTESYQYNSLGQLVLTETYNSKNEKLTSKFLYPIDANPTPGTIQQALINKGYYDRLLEQTSLKNDNVLVKQSYTYDWMYYDIELYNIQKAIKNQAPFIETSFSFYGPNFNPQHIIEKGSTTSLIWSDNNTKIIAKATGTPSFNDIAFTSFEAGASGGWSYNAASINSTSAITGKNSYTLSTSAPLSKSLYSNENYIISYWSNSGSYQVNGTSGVAGRVKGSWQYFEHKVLTGSNPTITISGNGLIDELRISPQGSLMTSYSYQDITGISSECDPNNRITYYEYDAFGRLSLVRDQDNNIIKKICYNYFGQVEDCGQSLSPLWQSTGQTRCQPCSANSAYTSGLRQHEEKDNNPASATYNQTRWIDDGMLCTVAADWQVQSVSCEVVNGAYTGNQVTIKKDMNPCSATYNQTTQITQVNCLSCPKPASWQGTGNYRCVNSGGVNTSAQEREEKDMETCSSTYNQLRWVSNGTNCTTCPKPQNWVATGNYRCVTDANGNTGYQEREERNQESCSPNYYTTRWVANGYNTTSCPLPSTCNYNNCEINGPQYKCINGFCEQGFRAYTGQVGNYCVYHYEWSDGSWSQDYYEWSGGNECFMQMQF